jgi:hypothetical protein
MNETAVELISCPECGGANPPAERRCWLCGHSLATGGAGRAAPSKSAADWVLSVTFAVVGIAVVLMLIGVAQESAGLAVGLALIAAVPLVSVAVASARGRARGASLTAGQKVAQFVVSLAIVLGVVGLLAVAAFIAFFIWCLSS